MQGDGGKIDYSWFNFIRNATHRVRVFLYHPQDDKEAPQIGEDPNHFKSFGRGRSAFHV